MLGCGREVDHSPAAVKPTHRARPLLKSNLVINCAHVAVEADLISGVLTAQTPYSFLIWPIRAVAWIGDFFLDTKQGGTPGVIIAGALGYGATGWLSWAIASTLWGPRKGRPKHALREEGGATPRED